MLLLAMLLAPLAAGQTQFSTLYTFTNGDPVGLRYADGVFYGATTGASPTGNCGTVFQLQPPATPGGAWTETALYSFNGGNSDGCTPLGTPVKAANGALYGITYGGGPTTAAQRTNSSHPASPARRGPRWLSTALTTRREA